MTTTETPAPVTETVTETPAPVTETVTETPTPVTETVTETPEPVTETVTETPNPLTETVTTTEKPEPATETVTATEKPEPATETVTITETPAPATTTETPNPLTETVTTTETPAPATTTETPAAATVTTEIKSGSSLGGGSSEGNVDERCLPAAIALAVPLLALVPLQLMQGLSLPVLDDLAGQINDQIASANQQIQEGLGIYDERAARAVEEFNAQIRQAQADNAQAFQAAGTVAVSAAVAGYFAYFCVPRSDEAKSSVRDSSSRAE